MNDSTASIRWLHLTDLHVGKPGQAQGNAITSLVSSIERQASGNIFDLVLLTGDLAYSGKASEYLEFERLVIAPLRAMDAFNGAEFVSVPGNHDLDCDEGLPVAWENLGANRQRLFFQDDSEGKKVRASRASAFRAYSDFVKRNSIISVDPTTEVALRRSLTIRDQTIDLILTATCFFSDKDVNDEQRCPSPVPAMRPLLSQGGNDRRTLVLGHHPIGWFLPETGRHLRTLLSEAQAVYLNGHEHEVKVEFNGRGLLALGFGASYQSSIDAERKAHYRNSYALCELGDVLSVSVVSWDHEHGRWNLDTNLPPDFDDQSDASVGGYRLPLPTTKLTNAGLRPYGTLAAGLQHAVSLDRCVWLASDSPKRWSEILASIGIFVEVAETYALPSKESTAGHFRFRVNDRRGSHLVHAISATGGVLTHEQLQTLNTDLDTQGYVSCTVVTLGSVASEASTLATQLKAKKPIDVMERDQLLRTILRRLDVELKKVISNSDPAKVRQWFVISDADIGVLRQDRASGAWFDVLDGKGRRLAESDQIVRKIRQDLPELTDTTYRGDSNDQPVELRPSAIAPFDRSKYLDACYSYFDDVKYAPLAAIGLKFRNTSLSAIYIDANADANESARSEDAVARAVEEFLDSLKLPMSQRDHLQAQLRARFATDRAAEVGAASQLYQRYGNVIVLGDPGSGKTCFVKHEILAYCKPAEVGGSWYSQHLPIYLSLSEAARLTDDEVDVVSICETTSARRGIPLPKEEILKSISAGQAAFFFDGLDEVGSIEKRSRLMLAISKQIDLYAGSGNRYVVASRPAAVQPVQIPSALKYLHLRGLSEAEIRVLAGRVLTVRLGEGAELSDDETQLIERLIEDTRNSPGIARIARNPLLLTLLVLIYANTGAVSTHRHVIYTQAIKTLISVRGRETREEQLSESDLRVRLGALALAIFGKQIAEIPRRSEVRKVLSPLLAGVDPIVAVDDFLQEVAEATGLLRVHPDESARENDLITFMHYSFLEYYAAAGILSSGQLPQLGTFAGKARWREVITLLFGILSEQGDVTPALHSILAGDEVNERITNARLLLALDCAAECDVPPVDSQVVLVATVRETMRTGAGRVSGALRREIADRLGRLIQGGVANRIITMLEEGLSEPDVHISSAFADLVANLPADVTLPSQIRVAFSQFLNLSDSIAPVIGMQALERRMDLRSENAPQAIDRCLKGNIVEKHAALSLIRLVPSYYSQLSDRVRSLLDDANDFIANLAAQCILYCDAVLPEPGREALQERVLMKLNVADRDETDETSVVAIDHLQIERMLADGSAIEKELALRYAPLIKGNAEFVHRTLIGSLRSSTNSRHQAAAMDALRAAPRALALLTIADTDLICSRAGAGERNVRVAAINLLGNMPDDEQVQLTLLSTLQRSRTEPGREAEMFEAAKAISRHSKGTPRLRRSVLDLVKSEMPAPGSFGSDREQGNFSSLLHAVESFSGIHDSAIASSLLRLGEDYRTPDVIRRHSLRVYGKLAEPAGDVATTFSRLLARNDVRLNESIYSGLINFLNECKRGMAFIRKVHPHLAELRSEVAAAWQRELVRSVKSVEVAAVRDLRQATADIEELLVQYGEYSERATVAR